MKALVAALFLLAVAGPNYEEMLKESKLTLSEALDKAQAEAKDCVPVAAELEKYGKNIIFSVNFAKEKKSHFLTLDVKEGKVTEKEESKLNQTKTVKSIKVTLKDAIDKAIKKVEGKAVWAGVVTKGKNTFVQVRVFKEGKLYAVNVNAEDGVVASSDEYKAPSKEQGFLGIQGAQASEDDDGVRIGSIVEDSAAEAYGLEDDDVIVSVNGEKVATMEELRDIVQDLGAGGKARFEIMRGTKKMKVTVILRARPEPEEEE